jgi:hypothetical protein
VNKKVENEVVDARCCCPVVLEEIEVWPAGFIQCDNLAIDNRVVWQISECFEDQRVLPVEGISPPGKQIQPASRFHGYGAVSIELDLVQPTKAVWELRDGQALHGLSKCS